jgi:hypothetical protein
LEYTEHRKGLETGVSGPVHVFGSVFKIFGYFKDRGFFCQQKKTGPGGCRKTGAKNRPPKKTVPPPARWRARGLRARGGVGQNRLIARVARGFGQRGLFPFPPALRKKAPRVGG